ncbi:MAG: glycosyltransferase family 4 protein [Deltaproteobacteria bacterium]|nr:glycosyltransferase family 4 protein [Deltaproteobacteria bacterium]
MRLVFIKKKFNPYGGAEKYLLTLIHHLKKEKEDIHIISADWPEIKGITQHFVNHISWDSTLSTWSFNKKASHMVDALKPDLTISFERTTCQDIYRAGDGCHQEWLAQRKKSSSLFKKLSFYFSPLHRTLLHFDKKIFTKTPYIIANSHYVKDQIIRYYKVLDSKIQVLYNGVDTHYFTPTINKEVRPFTLLFIGSDFERKGLEVVLKSLKLLPSNIKLNVVGKGNIHKYKKIAQEENVLERVTFLGPQKEISHIYHSGHILVLPTIYDPLSNVVLEALASGLPVITSKNNGASEMIENGKEGYILNDHLSHEELAQKMKQVINNLSSLSVNARKKSEYFSLEKKAQEFQSFINKIKYIHT